MFHRAKFIIIILSLFFSFSFVFTLSADIFKFKRIALSKNSFLFRRDIFNIKERDEKINIQSIVIIKKKKIDNKEKKTDIESEMKNHMKYEGSLKRNGKILALINVNGEFFIVQKGDIVLKKIKIVDVGKKKITISTDSVKIDILKKGETDG